MKLASITKYLLGSALLSMLVGCFSLGPDYTPKQWDGPEAWLNEAPATSPLPDGAAWWTVFKDPVLNDLEEKLLAQNPSLAAAIARLDASAAQIGIARASYAPSLDASASVQYDRQTGEVRSSTKYPNNPTWLYKPGVSLQWELDFWGRVRRNVEAASADFTSDFQDVLASRLLLTSELADSYISLRTLQTRLDYARKNVELQTKTLELVRTRCETGLSGELDLRQAEMNVASTRANIPPLEAKIDAAIHSIAILVGDFPGTQEALRKAAPIPLPDDAALPATVPADILRNRPDVAAAAHSIHAAVARIGAAKAEFFPKISLNGSFAFYASNTGRLFTSNAQNFSIGPAVEWPIFTAGRLRNQVRYYEASARAAEEDFRETVLTAISECESALSARRAANAVLADLRAAVTAAEKANELAESLYRSGLTDFQNVLDMQRQLASNQDDLAQGVGSAASALIEVWQSFGGPTPSQKAESEKR